jgi:putative flippase GtrA
MEAGMENGKVFRILIVLGIALFLLGLSQYYLSSVPSASLGNYLMATGIAIASGVCFIFLVNKNKFFMNQGKRYSLVMLFLLPLLEVYLLIVALLMILDMMDMPHHSIIRELGSINYQMLSSVGYWSTLIIFEAIILILLISKKPAHNLNSKNQL